MNGNFPEKKQKRYGKNQSPKYQNFLEMMTPKMGCK
jgi:hypothetical protein